MLRAGPTTGRCPGWGNARRDAKSLGKRPHRRSPTLAEIAAPGHFLPPACLARRRPLAPTRSLVRTVPRDRAGLVRMKLTVERTALLKSLGHVHRVVERRNTIPILANVLLRADKSALSLKATDLDLEVIETVAAETATGGATTV